MILEAVTTFMVAITVHAACDARVPGPGDGDWAVSWASPIGRCSPCGAGALGLVAP